MARKYDTCPACGAQKDVRAKECAACYRRRERSRLPATERFWNYVTKKGDDECWLWTGNTHSGEYGLIRDAGRNGKMWTAHRLSYSIHNGPIPDGMVVCHRCDNPRCVNPAHLFLGSQFDNIADRHAKGRDGRAFGEHNGTHTHPDRVARGARHYAARFTDDDIRTIRALKPATGVHEAATVVAQQYGCSKSHIIHIWYGHKWKHISDTPPGTI